jgi:glycosyltransferase involved in cell wall biosynthesis
MGNWLKDKIPFPIKLAVKRQQAKLSTMRAGQQADTFANYKENIHASTRGEVVVFDDRIPTPDLDAGSARMFLLLRLLAKHYRTVLIYKGKSLETRYERALWQEGIETFDLIHYTRVLKQHDFGCAIVSRPDIAHLVIRSLRRLAPKMKIIFDTVDAHYRRLELEYQLTGDPNILRKAKHYRKVELELVRLSDVVWCTSRPDEESLLADAPGKPVAIIPTVHPLHERGRPFDEREGLLFIGNFNHSPNSDAVEFFIESVLPLIRRSLPDVKFDVVGSNAPPHFEQYGSGMVCFHGYVPDIAPLFGSRRVFVAPLRFGAGVKGKIGDALSYGLPVVTTDVGAEGMGFENGKHILIANDAASFAEMVIRVYRRRELWEQLAEAGYQHISKFFSPEAVEKTAIDSIDQAVSNVNRKSVRR